MYHVKHILAEETFAIRQPILRKGKPIESCVFPGDSNKNTIHLGLFLNSQLIGVASLIKNKSPLCAEKYQYQLRGMAILEAFQQKGLGTYLLDACELVLVNKNVHVLWCHARETAVTFYKNKGFTISGDAFTIPNIGTHYTMFKKLS